MDLNYLPGREQHALYMAATSLSSSARMAHRAFARAYGTLIAGSGFPHRDSGAHDRPQLPVLTRKTDPAGVAGWESEGGSIRPTAPPPAGDSRPLQRRTSDIEGFLL